MIFPQAVPVEKTLEREFISSRILRPSVFMVL